MRKKYSLHRKVLLFLTIFIILLTVLTITRFYRIEKDLQIQIMQTTADNVFKYYQSLLYYSSSDAVTRDVVEVYETITPYDVKLTSLNVRNSLNLPDEWEKTQLDTFARDPSIPYIMESGTKKNDYQARFIKPLWVRQDCLKCHGGPAGEIDERGYPKEGLYIGDLAGAVRVSVPLENINPFTILQDIVLRIGVAMLLVLIMVVIHLVWTDW